MPSRKPAEQAFSDLLEGRPSVASADLARLYKVAKSLAPASRPAPNPQFRARLRNELLARASATAEDAFAALLDGLPIEAPEEIKPLVAIAAALEPARLPLPDPAFRFQLRNELLARAESTGSLGVRARSRFAAFNDRLRSKLRVLVATGMTAAVLAGSGAAMAAASHALPGDALYPVKLFRESAQLFIASGPDEGLKRLQFARERLTEVKGLEARGSTNSDLYVATLDRMDALTQTGATILIDSVRSGAKNTLLKRIDGFAAVQQQDLKALLPALPAAAQPAARDSLDVLRAVTRTVGEILSGCPCKPSSNPLVPSSSASSGSAGCTCATASGSGGSSSGGGSGGPTAGGTDSSSSSSGSTAQPPSTQPQQTTIVDQVPDIPGTTADNDTKSLVDQLLQPITSPLPTLSPSLPLPSTSSSLSLNLTP
jgi:hypothetical protein